MYCKSKTKKEAGREMKTKVCVIQEKNINFADMIELSKHIEVLLLENDCVIVPGLGGFIAHYRSSVYREDLREYCPPVRTIGFNPQLVMNDGLLVQSYMQAYDTDFPDATRRIETTVALLKEELYKKGQFTLGSVGTLYYNMSGGYGFEPCTEGYFTPSLYGLQRFSLSLLPEISSQSAPKKALLSGLQMKELPKQRTVLKPMRQWLQTAVAVAAAIFLFFVLSVPVENTYMDDANYASLGTATLFDAIRSQSVTTQLGESPVRQDVPHRTSVKAQKQVLKPVAVKTEKVAKTSFVPANKIERKKIESVRENQTVIVSSVVKRDKPAVQSKQNRPAFYVIIASLTTRADAERELKKMQENGCANALVLESEGKYRIAFEQYRTQADAYKKVQELRKQEAFKNAWIFTSNK